MIPERSKREILIYSIQNLAFTIKQTQIVRIPNYNNLWTFKLRVKNFGKLSTWDHNSGKNQTLFLVFSSETQLRVINTDINVEAFRNR